MADASQYDRVPPGHTGIVYTCPMHPQVRDVSNTGCPICGMALEPETASLGEEDTSELDDMTRRFYLSALLTVPLPDAFFQRIQTIRTYEQVDDNSALGRLHFWRVAFSMAGDHPLGVGLKNYEANFNRYDSSYGAFGWDRDVHSTHLQALVETGYLGFLCYVGLLWTSVVLLLRIRRRAAHPALTPEEIAQMLMKALQQGADDSMLTDQLYDTLLVRSIRHVIERRAARDRASSSAPTVTFSPTRTSSWMRIK